MKKSTLIFLFCFAASLTSNATKYFVNKTVSAGDVYTLAAGSNANPGTSALPFLTLGKALSVATAGDTIYVDADTYNSGAGASPTAEGGYTIGAAQAGLKIIGAGISATIFDGTNYMSSTAISNFYWLNITGNNVEIRNLTLKKYFKQGAIDITASAAATDSSRAYLTNIFFDNNESDNTYDGVNAQGGAVWVSASTKPAAVYFTNCNFNQNIAETSAGGGALFAQASGVVTSNLILEGCRLTCNSTTGVDLTTYDGGAILLNNSSTKINNSFLYGNRVNDRWGGAIYAINTLGTYLPVSVTNSMFVSNIGRQGTAIFTKGNYNTTLTNSLFYGNSTTSGFGNGGTINCDGTTNMLITNCTVANNLSSGTDGSGLAVEASSSYTVLNSIIYGNQVGNVSSASITATYCDIQAVGDLHSGVTGNISSNPTFTNASNFTLQAGSLAINAGTLTGAPTVDFTGAAHIGNPDMGCFEFGSTYPTVSLTCGLFLNCTSPTVSSVSATTAICSSATFTSALTSATAGATYTWLSSSVAGVSGHSNFGNGNINETLTLTGASSVNVTYTITPTSGACVGTATTFTVNVVPKPTMTSSNTASVCSGTALSLALTSSAASTYSWIATDNTNTTGESLSSQSSSTLNDNITNNTTSAQSVIYTVTPTSSVGSCAGTGQTVTVTVNPKPSMTSANTTSVCSGTALNFSLSSNVASSYSWIATDNTNTTGESTSAQASSTINNTIINNTSAAEAVVYTVTPTATAGSCLGTAQTVTVTVNPKPTMTSANTASVCSGVALSVSLTSNVLASYSWLTTNNVNTSGESTSAQATSTINDVITNSTTAAQTLNYTVTPTATAGSCLGTAQTVTVTVNPTPAMTSANTATICSGGTVTIPLTSNVASSYSWIASDNTNTVGESTTVQATASISNTITSSSTVAETVTYSVTPTTTVGSCAGTVQTVTVTVNPKPTMTSTNNASVCSGTALSVALTSNVASSYSWLTTNNVNTTGESTSAQASATINDVITNSTTAAQTLNYTVTPTATLGSCVGTAQTVTVTVNPKPTMTSANTASVCSGATINLSLTSNVAASYSWLANDNVNTTGESTSAQASSTINDVVTNSTTAAQTLNYTVTPTATVGSCLGTAQTVTVTVNPTPTMTSANSATICSGGTLNVPLTSSIASTYSWIAADNVNTIGESTSAQATSTINNTLTSSSGVQELVSYTVTPTASVGSCLGTPQTFTATVNPLPATPLITALNPTTFCAGDSTQLSSSSITGNVWSTAETTQVISVYTGGNYSLTVTDGNNCTSPSASIAVTVNPLPATPTITASGPTTFCANDSVTLTSSSAVDNVWSTGATTQSITVHTAGTYLLNVLDANKCNSLAASITINVNPLPVQPVITASGPTTFCAGDSVTLYSSAVTGNLWSTGSINDSIVVLNSGTYSVTVTDGNNCTSLPASTAITANPLPTTPTITANGPTTFCAGDSVILSSSALTGNLWSTGSTNDSITVLNSGTYSVTITDGNNCTSAPASVVVTLNPLPPSPTITMTGQNVFCAGDSVTLFSSALTGNLWSTGSTNSSIVVYNSGNYSLTVTDGNNCTSPATSTVITVISNPATPTISASGPTTFCEGDSISLTSSAIAGNTWSTGETTQTIVVHSAGTYTVTVGASGCSSVSAGTTITVNPLPSQPIITAGGPTTFCAGDSVTLTSNAATGNLWSTGATTQSIVVHIAGTYSLSVTDANSCKSPDTTMNIVVNPLPPVPTVSANGPLSFCSGDSVTLTSSSAAGNLWNNGATTQSITVYAPGSFSLIVTDANSCTNASATTAVAVFPTPAAPTISNTGLVFCIGGSTTLTSSSTIGNLWSTSATTQSIVVTTAGNYWLVDTNANGCTSDTAFANVIVNPLPTAPTISADGPLTFCAGDSVHLTSNPTTGIVWTPGSSSNSTITVTTSGTYSVTLTDVNGCVNVSTPISVVVNSIPNAPTLNVSGNNNSICAGQTATITATPGTGITWSPGGQATSSIAVTTSGTYNATYTDANGCTSPLASVSITVNPNPVIDPSMTINAATCGKANGTITNVNVTSGTAPYTYLWLNGTTTIGSNQTLNNIAAGTYSLVITDQAGCSDTSGAEIIPSNGGIHVTLTGSPLTGTEPVTSTLLATTTVHATSFTWLLNNSIIAGETDSITILNNLVAGNYVAAVAVSDAFGCLDTATIMIEVDPYINIIVPNIFTPNGDNINEFFEIKADGIKEMKVAIYDRWGLLLYQATGATIKWDGKVAKGDAPDGTYYYILNATDINGVEKEYTGHVLLTR